MVLACGVIVEMKGLISYTVILLVLTSAFRRGHETAVATNGEDACGLHGVCQCRLQSRKEYVGCLLAGLLKLPSGIPANVSILNLECNKIKTLDEKSFHHMPVLEKLFLERNLLTTLPTGLFSTSFMLEELEITRNNLEQLPEYLLRYTSKLSKVDLRSNVLTTIPRELFSQTSVLKELNLCYNKIRDLPEHLLRNTSKLIKLSLCCNKLRTFKKDFFQQLRNLQQLDLSGNLLTNIDVNVLSFSNMLTKLSLSRNNLTTIPSHLFNQSCWLLDLDISSNQLKHLPECLLCNTTKLFTLDLHNNKLENFGKGFFRQLTNLRELYLDNNLLANLDLYTLSSLKFLQILDVRMNNMKIESTSALSSLGSLKQLWLSGNRIEKVPEDSFRDFHKIDYLELNNNSLKHIPDLLFSSMELLNKLFMEDNRIVEIRTSHFATLHMLRFLYLRWNKIQYIEKDSFQALQMLTELHLSHNSIASLPENIFSTTPLLQQIDLSSNMMSEVHEELFNNMLDLFILNLTNNAISNLPETLLSDSKELVILGLDYNNMQEVPVRLFRDLKDLNSLDLSFNKIQELPENIFDDVAELLFLSVSNNNISSLEWNLFSHVELSSSLDLSNNWLTSLSSKLFDSNNKTHQVETLLLHRNRIEYLPKDVFGGLPWLKSLCLFYNNIQTLADRTFAGVGGKIYLFGNKLSNMNTTSFNNKNIEEIHLYGNKIGWFNKTAFKGISNNTKVFIDCQQVEHLHQTTVNIICVTPKFVPVLFVNNDVSVMMGREGFRCESPKTIPNHRCSPCPRGTFSNGENECIPCPPGGYYQDEIGITDKDEICKECSNGTFVKNGGGQSIGDCAVCPDGTNKELHAGYRACPCLDQYARKDRLGPCYLCLEKGVNCSGRDYKSINPGFYWSWDFAGANLTSYRKFVNNLENEDRYIDSYAKYEGKIPRPINCPRRESCNNTVGDVDVTCSLGYTGWLCSRCDKNYYSVMNHCLPCPEKEWLFIEVALTLCVCVVIYACLFRFYKMEKSQIGQERSVIDIFISRGKIALGFYQVVGEFFASLHEINWASTLEVIGNLMSVIELNILRFFIRPQCFHEKLVINPKIEFLIAMTFLILMILASFVICQLMIMYYKYKTRYTVDSETFHKYTKVLKSKFLAGTIILLFVVYAPMCTIIFQLLPRACETFCLDMTNNNCKILLRSDYDIECKNLKLYHIFAYAATVGYVVAYPAVLFFLLRKNSQSYLPQSVHVPNVSINEDDEDDQEILIDNTVCNAPSPIWVDFLCESYKPQYWYWEIVELTRKMTQTVLITLLGWENKLTVLVTICISVAFLILHARYMPMRSMFEQRLQMFSLVAILVNVLVAAMDVPGEYGNAMSVTLIALNAVVIVIIGGELVFGLCVRLRHIKVHELLMRFIHPTCECFHKRSQKNTD